MVVYSRLLGTGILCSCGSLGTCGHNVLFNLQQDKCYFLFCEFYLWMNGILKVRALRMALLYILGYGQHCFTEGAEPVRLNTGNRAQRLKQKEQI